MRYSRPSLRRRYARFTRPSANCGSFRPTLSALPTARAGAATTTTKRSVSPPRLWDTAWKAQRTCRAIGLTKQDVCEKLNKLKNIGVENILALRGDLPAGNCAPGDFEHASDLIAFIKEQGEFNIIAACYPEGHVEAKNKVEDIQNLKRKVDAGTDQLITQLFFDNEYFYSFAERCALAGIDVPIEAGIMPVVNKRQIERMSSLCGATVPKKFTAMMERYEHNPVAMRDAGIAYAVDQIVDLIAQGVDGIHLYTMNNPYIARRIHEAVHSLIA